MKRIVYTLAIGEPRYAECALGLGRSLKLIGDQTRRVVVTDLLNYPWERTFDEVLEPRDMSPIMFWNKLSGLVHTDADQVLYVDADCLVFKRLGPIFDRCQGNGICLQTRDWGMIYYERTAACMARMNGIREMHLDRSNIKHFPGGSKDGSSDSLSRAADFCCSPSGLVGKLQLDVLRNRCSFVRYQEDLRLVKPFIFHASQHVESTNYWRELGRLRKLEEYAQSHEPGYVSPRQKLQRSIEKRYLKFIRRKL